LDIGTIYLSPSLPLPVSSLCTIHMIHCGGTNNETTCNDRGRDRDGGRKRLTTPTFYAFDIGKRFTGPELSKLIADSHKAGRTIEWSIGPVDARAGCATAFAAWENTGAAGTAEKMEPRAWLESAYLVRQGDRWAIDFLHSTPKDPHK
jgi:hypothetical protein